MVFKNTPINKRLSNEQGVSMLEFAITVPVFVLILLGMISFGPLIRDLQVLPEAVRHGARSASVQSLELIPASHDEDDPRPYPCGEPTDNPLYIESLTAHARGATLEYLANTKLQDLIPLSAILAEIDDEFDMDDPGIFGPNAAALRKITVSINTNHAADCTLCVRGLVRHITMGAKHTFILDGTCEF